MRKKKLALLLVLLCCFAGCAENEKPGTDVVDSGTRIEDAYNQEEEVKATAIPAPAHREEAEELPLKESEEEDGTPYPIVKGDMFGIYGIWYDTEGEWTLTITDPLEGEDAPCLGVANETYYLFNSLKED